MHKTILYIAGLYWGSWLISHFIIGYMTKHAIDHNPSPKCQNTTVVIKLKRLFHRLDFNKGRKGDYFIVLYLKSGLFFFFFSISFDALVAIVSSLYRYVQLSPPASPGLLFRVLLQGLLSKLGRALGSAVIICWWSFDCSLNVFDHNKIYIYIYF